MEKLRRSHPECVPVVCENLAAAADSSKRIQKLIVPHCKTGRELLCIFREKCTWASSTSPVSLCVGEGSEMEVPMETSLRELDSKYQAADGALYFRVGAAGAAAEAEAETAAETKPKESIAPISEFKMNLSVKKDTSQESKAKLSKSQAARDDPAERARRICQKHPDRVPVIVNQAPQPGLPLLEKKLLVPKTITCHDLKKILPKHLNAETDVDWPNVRMLMAGDSVEDHEKMIDVYNQRVDPDDGGLLLTLEMASMDEHIEKLSFSDPGPEVVTEPEEEASSAAPASHWLPPSSEEVEMLQRQLLAAKEAFDVQEEKAEKLELQLLKAKEDFLQHGQDFVNKEVSLESDLKEAKELRAMSEAMLAKTTAEVEALRSENAALVQSLSSCNKRLEQDAALIEKLEQDFETSQSKLALESIKVEEAQETILVLQEEVQQCQQFADLREVAERLQEEVELKQARILELDSEVDALNATIRVMETENREMEKEKHILLREAAKPNEALEALKAKLRAQDLQLAKKDEMISAKGADAADCRSRVKGMEIENRRLEDELKVAVLEKSKMAEGYAHLEGQTAQLMEEVKQLREQLQKKEEKDSFVMLGWNHEGEVAEVSEDFGFQKVDAP